MAPILNLSSKSLIHFVASYFGDSYQFLPSTRAASRLIPDVSSTVTKFELWFKTAQLNGLLVKAVSSSGTFAIRLRNGRLEVSLVTIRRYIAVVPASLNYVFL